VVIHDLNVMGIASMPDKAYTPLHIDADGILPGAILAKLMKPVTGQQPKHFNTWRGMQNFQTPPGLRLKRLESPNRPIMEQQFSVAVFE